MSLDFQRNCTAGVQRGFNLRKQQRESDCTLVDEVDSTTQPNEDAPLSVLRCISLMNTNFLELWHVKHVRHVPLEMWGPIDDHVIGATRDGGLTKHFDTPSLQVAIEILQCLTLVYAVHTQRTYSGLIGELIPRQE